MFYSDIMCILSQIKTLLYHSHTYYFSYYFSYYITADYFFSLFHYYYFTIVLIFLSIISDYIRVYNQGFASQFSGAGRRQISYYAPSDDYIIIKR